MPYGPDRAGDQGSPVEREQLIQFREEKPAPTDFLSHTGDQTTEHPQHAQVHKVDRRTPDLRQVRKKAAGIRDQRRLVERSQPAGPGNAVDCQPVYNRQKVADQKVFEPPGFPAQSAQRVLKDQLRQDSGKARHPHQAENKQTAFSGQGSGPQDECIKNSRKSDQECQISKDFLFCFVLHAVLLKQEILLIREQAALGCQFVAKREVDDTSQLGPEPTNEPLTPTPSSRNRNTSTSQRCCACAG